MPTTHLVRGADGTGIRVWCNDAVGEPVLLCNGLSAPPEAWAQVVARDSGFRVITWYQRGLGGSERPADRIRIRVEDHADDARAVLDGSIWARRPWWAGRSGSTWPSSRPWRSRPGCGPSWPPPLSPAAATPRCSPMYGAPPAGPDGQGRQPVVAGGGTAAAVGRGEPAAPARLPSPAAVRGPAGEVAHPAPLRAVLHDFSRHDWPWYRRLAVALAEHAPLDVSSVRCPVTFLAGRYDSLVDVADVRAAARAVPGARIRERAGTHVLPLQYPEVMLAELLRLSGA